MRTDLKEAYQRLGESVPPMGDLDRALIAARRRRRRRVAAAPLLAGALVVAGSLAVDPPWSRESPRPATTPEISVPTETTTFNDWVPYQRRRGATAPVGTAVYRSCESGGCTVSLLRPDRSVIDLAMLRDDLAKQIAANGLGGASLSWDAKWLGFRVGRSYQLHDLDTGEAKTLPAGPPNSQWSVVGWGVGSFNVSLAQYQGNQVLRYALVDFNPLDGPTVYIYTNPLGARTLPTQHIGDGVMIALPIDMSASPVERTRVTQLPVDSLMLKTGQPERQGSISRVGAPRDIYGSLLRDSETLAGPRGVPEVLSCGPSPKAPEVFEICAIPIYARYGRTLQPKAFLLSGTDEKAVRLGIDLPSGSGSVQALGVLGQGIGIAYESPDGRSVELVEFATTGRRMIHQLPRGSQVLLPGSVSR